MKKKILGINITNRVKDASKLQALLTEYGCYIKTRIGLHDISDNFCSSSGLIILELFGEHEKLMELENKLKAIEGTEVEKMVFGN